MRCGSQCHAAASGLAATAAVALPEHMRHIDGHQMPDGASRGECYDCHRYFLASEILVDLNDPDLRMVCFPCLQGWRFPGFGPDGRPRQGRTGVFPDGRPWPHPAFITLNLDAEFKRQARYEGSLKQQLMKFHKEVLHNWLQRKRKTNTYRLRTRISKFEDFLADLHTSHPGAANKELRKHITEFSVWAAANIAAAAADPAPKVDAARCGIGEC